MSFRSFYSEASIAGATSTPIERHGHTSRANTSTPSRNTQGIRTRRECFQTSRLIRQCQQPPPHADTYAPGKDNVQALIAELLELKATVAALERSTPTAETNSAGGGQVRGGGQDKLPWNVVARGKKQGKGKGSTSTSKAYMPKGVSSGITVPQSSEPSKPPRVQVKGARRIWGTMKSATTAVVANVLKTLAKVPQNSLSVKRKYKVTNNNLKHAGTMVVHCQGGGATLGAIASQLAVSRHPDPMEARACIQVPIGRFPSVH